LGVADHDVLHRAPAVDQNTNLTTSFSADFGQPAREVMC